MEEERINALLNEMKQAGDWNYVSTSTLEKWYDEILDYVMAKNDKPETAWFITIMQSIQGVLDTREDASPAIERLLLKSPNEVYQIISGYNLIDLKDLYKASKAFRSDILRKQFCNMLDEAITNLMISNHKIENF